MHGHFRYTLAMNSLTPPTFTAMSAFVLLPFELDIPQQLCRLFLDEISRIRQTVEGFNVP